MGRNWKWGVGLGLALVAGAGCLGSITTDLGAPFVDFTNPLEGAVVSGVVNLTATASDDTGVTLVTFSAGGTKLGEDEIPPYSWLWSTQSRANGPVKLRVEARDAAGNTAFREITVTVNNVPQ